MIAKRGLVILDDEPDFCDLIEFVGRRAGFSVTSATDSRVFQTLPLQQVDLVVLDINMPHIDGIEILRFLADSQLPIAVILVSGAERGILNAARQFGMAAGLHIVGVFEKPVDLSSIERAMALLPDSDAQRPHGGSREALSAGEVRAAIDESRIVVYVQPKLHIARQTIDGAEALARIVAPDGTVISPDGFIHVAEQHDMMGDLTASVAHATFAAASSWQEAGLYHSISFNVSVRNLLDVRLPELLLREAVAAAVPISRITIEITETVVAESVRTYLDILGRLRLKGFGLSIDDFGTGYSSLLQLQAAPFSEIKIDRAFVSAMVESSESKSIVETSIELAHRLNLDVIAEGVENQEQLNALAILGCDRIQGYHIAAPMPVDDYPAFCAAWQAQD